MAATEEIDDDNVHFISSWYSVRATYIAYDEIDFVFYFKSPNHVGAINDFYKRNLSSSYILF